MHLSYSIAPQTVFLLAEAETGKKSSVASFALEDNRLALTVFNFSRIDLAENNSMNSSITFC